MKQQRRWTSYLSLAMFLAVAAGCLPLHAQTVRANWKLNAPFATYKTYAWQPGTETNHPFYRQYVDEYVNYALTAKKKMGRVSESQSPDLLVQYHFATQNTVDTTTTYWSGGGGWGGWGWGGWGWGMGGPGYVQTQQHPRTIGILTLDMIDAKTNQLVWRGQAIEDNIAVAGKNEEKQVAMSVYKMLQRYPPPIDKKK